MVNFNRRFDRDYAELHRVVTEGEIGDVELIQLSTRGPSMPPLDYIATSGGQMRDQTVHFFDLDPGDGDHSDDYEIPEDLAARQRRPVRSTDPRRGRHWWSTGRIPRR